MAFQRQGRKLAPVQPDDAANRTGRKQGKTWKGPCWKKIFLYEKAVVLLQRLYKQFVLLRLSPDGTRRRFSNQKVVGIASRTRT